LKSFRQLGWELKSFVRIKIIYLWYTLKDMDAKITLSFDESVIARAKQFAEEKNISLSRLMEFMLDKITSKNYKSLEDIPVSEWVNIVSEGQAEYKTRKKSRKQMKNDFYKAKK
jgi:antitoxin component of RelBE/YafQ-DinJ toxin-antitoxin module